MKILFPVSFLAAISSVLFVSNASAWRVDRTGEFDEKGARLPTPESPLGVSQELKPLLESRIARHLSELRENAADTRSHLGYSSSDKTIFRSVEGECFR